MKCTWKHRKLFIILIWAAFLSTVGIIFFSFENRLYDRTAKERLVEQSESISRQLPEIIENDYCSQITALQTMLAKLRSLALELEPYDSIEDAKPFLDAFIESADINAIKIYDRQGNVLYKTTDDPSFSSAFSDEEIRDILDTRLYELVAQDMDYREEFYEPFFIESDGVYENSDFFWGVGDRWLISMRNSLSDAQLDVETFFAWSNVLQGVKIGRSGYILSFNPETNSIISCPDDNLKGSPIEALNIYTDHQITTVEELESVLGEPGEIIKLKIDGSDCYSLRLAVESVLLQVVLPWSEIRGDVNRSFFTLYFLLLLVTLLCLIYALIHANDDDSTIQRKGAFGWNKTLAGKLNFVSAIAIVGVFVAGIYLEALAVNADIFNYSFKVDEIVKVSRANSEALENLQSWCDKEALTRSRIARTILSNKNEEDVTWEYLDTLSQTLNVRYIYVFDSEGNVTATNSPYDRIVIDQSSPFSELLKGRPYLIQKPKKDDVTGELLQTVGISVRDEENRSDGCILLTVIPGELETIRQNLGFEGIFNQIGLSNETVVIVVDNTASTIEYMAKIENGKYNSNIAAFDYLGKDISSAGISQQQLKDDFNGNLFVLENHYFASVRQSGDLFYLVMRPKVGLEASDFTPTIIVTVTTILFLLQLVLFSCLERDPENGERGKVSAEELSKAADETEK